MKRLLLLLVFLFFVGLTAGFSYDLKVEDRISSKDDPAVFNLTVTNNYDVEDRFRISSLQAPPVVQSWFQYDFSKPIGPGETKHFDIIVEHKENVLQQNYGFVLNLRSFNRGERATVEDFFRVENPVDLGIESVDKTRDTVDPGETFDVNVNVRSTAAREVENFTVIASFLNQTREKEGTVIGTGSSIGYEFSFSVPEDVRPGRKIIDLRVERDGELDDRENRSITVSEIDSLKRDSISEDNLLTRGKTVEVTNTGNVKSLAEVERRVQSFLMPLTTTEPAPDSRESGNKVLLKWREELEPGETVSFSYKVDYTPAALFVILFVIAVIGMKKIGADLDISKTAKQTDEGIEILIELVNDSGRRVQDVEVKDFVPDIARVNQNFEMAKPVQTKTSNGTRLRWKVEALEPGEERLMKYKIHPMVEVEGGAVLSGAELLVDGKKESESSDVEVEFTP